MSAKFRKRDFKAAIEVVKAAALEIIQIKFSSDGKPEIILGKPDDGPSSSEVGSRTG
jgi:hypothetical protein